MKKKNFIHVSSIEVFIIGLLVIILIQFNNVSIKNNTIETTKEILAPLKMGLIPDTGLHKDIESINLSTDIGNYYFVSVSGNDQNPGTITLPWKTLRKAASKVVAGDTIYIRGGIYYESVSFTSSGTMTSPITITAYLDENAVIDGQNNIPGTGGSLLSLNGDYIQISNIEVRNSAYMGVYVYGSHVIVDNLYVHHSQYQGIFVSHGQYSVIENSRIYRNSLFNEYMKGQGNASGISAARQGVSYATIRNNIVWENWGEGISSFEADHIIIEGNISHDNFSNIYISDSTNILCMQNFTYTDQSSYIFSFSDNMGIMMGDEKYTPPSSNISIINNISFGNRHNFYWWQGVQGGGMKNVIIANNTFVNSIGSFGIIINQGSHSNVLFQNNLVRQDGPNPPILTYSNPEVRYLNNLWSKPPINIVLSSGDFIGDPLFLGSDDPFSPDWYLLDNASPAIGRAISLSLANIDYFGNYRGNSPDIGATENDPIELDNNIFLPMLIH